jgi:pimeloyl-ACP methyl ester carboxylesterase
VPDPTAACPFGEVAGDPAAPGIVFVHGTRMAAAYWHVRMEVLGQRFRVVAVDLPGHGRRRTVYGRDHANALSAYPGPVLSAAVGEFAEPACGFGAVTWEGTG